MLVVTPLPFTEIQPVMVDESGEPLASQPLATGAVPVGVNAFAVEGGVYPNVARLGRVKGGGPGVLAVTHFAEGQMASGGSDYDMIPLDAERALKLFGQSQQLTGAITALVDGKAKRTDEFGGGAAFGQDAGLPQFWLATGHPTTPSGQDRWQVYESAAWVVGTDVYTIVWLAAGAFGGYPNENFIYLVKWKTKADVNLASVTSLTQLDANGTWLQAEAFDLDGDVFFAAERMNFLAPGPDGSTDARTRLRAYDYAGNLLHRSDPINVQNYTGTTGSLSSEARQIVKSYDGSIVVGITTNEQLAPSDHMQTTVTLRRYTWTGADFSENASVDTDVIVSNRQSYFVNMQEIPDGSGRLFLDLVVQHAAPGTSGYERERVLRVVDSSFATLEETVLPMTLDQQDEWSSIAPGSLGLLGHNDYPAGGGWDQVSTVYMVQYDPIEGVDGDLTGTRREFS